MRVDIIIYTNAVKAADSWQGTKYSGGTTAGNTAG